MKTDTNLRIIFVLMMAILLAVAACGGNDPVEQATDSNDEVTNQPETAEITETDEDSEEPEVEPEAEPEQEQETVEEVVEDEDVAEEPETVAEETDQTDDDLYEELDVATAVPTIFSDPNEVRGTAFFGETLWAATLGGMVAWDLQTGAPTVYTTLDGLPHIGAHAVTVCNIPEPTLIAATTHGLATYDSASDRWLDGAYLLDTSEGTVGPSIFNGTARISDVVCDQENGRLIMAYNDVTVLDLTDGVVTSYTRNNDGLAWGAVEDIEVIGSDIWVASGFKGVSVIHSDGSVTVHNIETGFPADKVHDIEVEANGTIYMAADEGLVVLNTDGSTQLITQDDAPNMPAGAIYSLEYFAGQGILWLGMTNALCPMDIAGTFECTAVMQREEGMPEGRVYGLHATPDRTLYYHTLNNGVARFNPFTQEDGRWTNYMAPALILSNFVSALAQDDAYYVWIAGDGFVRRSDPNGQVAEEVLGFFGDNALLAHGNGGGMWSLGDRTLFYLEPWQEESMRWNKEDGLRDAHQGGLALDDQFRVWVGSEGGVSIFDRSTFSTVDTSQGYPDARTHALLWDGTTMWAGTHAGLVRLTDSSAELVLAEDALGNDPAVRAMAFGEDGRIILAGNFGLATFDGQTATLLNEDVKFVTVAVAPNGDIFAGSVSSGTAGLYHFDGSTWTHFTTRDGLPSNSVRTVLVSVTGEVWVGMGDTNLGGGVYFMRHAPQN
ncbi:ligand-binding sensor domain-containing protein [Candidatus Leptofilum sp.]|uniref:ligand-binding sensor domain-containing protein n=1 Tax=Candidatus Leptofilum sp. TaxID=3241576 RepID=UPI003B5B2451